MFGRRELDDVFNMGREPSKHTYYDRGGLDRRVRSSLSSGIHVAIHGESKHGKSWLRARTLPEKKIARAQILPGMSAGAVLEDALFKTGAAQRMSITVEVSRESETTTTSGVNVKAVKLGTSDQVKQGRRQTVQSQPVGEGPAHLNWIAEQFQGKVPVFEDFHNLDSDQQFAMAYIIKALGELGVPCVVVGIWTDTHLLKLYNGELDGRIEDIKLEWTFQELEAVARRGSRALNVELSDEICSELARDAYTSVGLLQELTRATLQAAGITHRTMRRKGIDDLGLLVNARAKVVQQISSRFDPFVQRLPQASIEGLREQTIPSLTRAVVDGHFSESALLEGIALDDLLRELSIDDADLSAEGLRTALGALEQAQRSVDIRPSVLAYDQARQRLILADRRLLLYLRERPFV